MLTQGSREQTACVCVCRRSEAVLAQAVFPASHLAQAPQYWNPPHTRPLYVGKRHRKGGKVLIVATSADKMRDHMTGAWYETIESRAQGCEHCRV